MLDFIQEKKNCTACGACANICPKHCISFEKDENGFIFPIKNEEKCNNCGLCKKFCPINSNMTKRTIPFEKQRYFAFCIEREDDWEMSTSGGAFTAICNAIVEKYGRENVVFAGVVMDNMRAKHILSSDFRVFRKSKYVQSDMGCIYRDMETALNSGKTIVFSGTPCQVAGVSSYFSHKPVKPILIDFVCHGVGSQAIFDDYIKELSAGKKKVVDYTFRERQYFNGNLLEYVSKITYDNGKKKYVDRDMYVQAFLNQKINRDSCLQNCAFRHKERLSDFTLGDFRDVKKAIAQDIKFPSRNYSMVTINSQLAMDCLKFIEKQGDLIECKLENIVAMNPLFVQNSNIPNGRNEFLELRQKYGTYRALKKVQTIRFYSPTMWAKYISPQMKRLIKRFFFKNRRDV